jgi:hypothetical protein
MKAMGHADLKMTMIYVDIVKPPIREQVEKLAPIDVPPSPQRMEALPSAQSNSQ